MSPLQKLILDVLKERGITRYALAKRLGVSPSQVYRWLSQPTRVEIAVRILHTLGLESRPDQERFRVAVLASMSSLDEDKGEKRKTEKRRLIFRRLSGRF